MVSGVATSVINTGLIFLSYPLYLHFLGYEKLGVWLVLSTIISFVQMSNLGLGSAVTKLVAEEYGRGDIAAIQGYVATALATLMVTGIIALGALILFRTSIVGIFRLGDDNARTAIQLLPFMGILTLYVFLVQILSATLSGLGRMDQVNYRDSFCRVISLSVGVALLYRGFGLIGLLVASAVSNLFMHAASVVLIRRIISVPLVRIDRWDRQRFTKLLSFGGGVLGSSLISMFLSPFNKLMLSRYAGVSTVPIYEIAFTGSMQIRSLVEVALRALMPEISRIAAEKNEQSLKRVASIYRRSIRIIWSAGFPVYVLAFLLATPLLKVWLGGTFLESLPVVFRIMLIGSFLSLLCVPAYYTLMGFSGIKHCFLSSVAQAITNVSIVSLIVLTAGVLSIHSFAWSVMCAHGVTCAYVLLARWRTLAFAQELVPTQEARQ